MSSMPEALRKVVIPSPDLSMTEVSAVSHALPAHHAYKVDAGAFQLPLYLCCQVLLTHSKSPGQKHTQPGKCLFN